MITVQDIERFVEAHPDQTNHPDVNQYVHDDGSPCCVFGHILAGAGVPNEELQWNAELEDYQRFFDSLETVEFATCMQNEADEGIPWGQAFANAKDQCL